MHVYRLDLGLFSHPKEFWGIESEAMLTPRQKIPSTGEKKSPQRRIEPTTLHQAGQRAQHTTNELFRPQLVASNMLVISGTGLAQTVV